jgi:hypothetical protein
MGPAADVARWAVRRQGPPFGDPIASVPLPSQLPRMGPSTRAGHLGGEHALGDDLRRLRSERRGSG